METTTLFHLYLFMRTYLFNKSTLQNVPTSRAMSPPPPITQKRSEGPTENSLGHRTQSPKEFCKNDTTATAPTSLKGWGIWSGKTMSRFFVLWILLANKVMSKQRL